MSEYRLYAVTRDNHIKGVPATVTCLTRRVRATVGYTFFYMSEVVRPGDQIDRVVNPTQLPTAGAFVAGTTPTRPSFPFQSSDFWAQGLNFGLEIRY